MRRLSTLPQTRGGWRAYGREVPAVFRRHGFRFLDLREVRDVPCAEDDFDYGNDGWHVDRGCAAVVRRRLDAAAR